MDATKMIIVADILFGVLLFAVSMPLVYRKVPMNDLYGVRIRAAFESEQRWYDINAYGGRQLAKWSWLPICSGVAGFFIPSEAFAAYAIANIVTLALTVFIPLFLISRWTRRH
jgi:hypothetical protein